MFPGVRVFIGSLKQGKQVPERGTSSFSHSGGAARGDREKIPIKKGRDLHRTGSSLPSCCYLSGLLSSSLATKERPVTRPNEKNGFWSAWDGVS